MDIATGAMSTLLPKLGKLLVGEYKLHKGVKREIQELKSELEGMNVALLKVSKVPADQLDVQVKLWATDVKDLSYNLEDTVDIFMKKLKGHEPTRQFSFKGFIGRATSLYKKAVTNHQIHNVIKDIMGQVKKVSERRDRYKVDGFASQAITVTVDPRLEAMYRKATELVGIDGPKNELAKRLMEKGSSSKYQANIISIVGFGGLGKTILANALLRDLQKKFDFHIFVSVSLNPDIMKIYKNILSQLGATVNEAWDAVQLINKIREILEDKRCLCVIDDVWQESAWDTIKLALQDGNHGSKIIITTRNKAIAVHVGGGVYELKPLSDDDSRRLLHKRIFDSEDACPPDLRDVTEKILKKCGGVPLAIISTTSLLASKRAHSVEWEKVNNSIGSGIGNSLHIDNMRKILRLSYNDLPSHLKTCLLSLSKYPEDKKIRKDVLIWSWIAEGFITETQPAGTRLEEIGESYFVELINRSLIQPADIDLICFQDGEVHACQVHDMVLELINQLSTEESFVTTILSDGKKAGAAKVHKRNIRRLSLHNSGSTYVLPGAREELSIVRSLSVFGRADSMPPLSSFRVLRILQLEDCTGLDINHLKHLNKMHLLRVLRLSGPFITMLPENIGNLESLETLDIRGTQSEILLPISFVKIRKLERLLTYRAKVPQGMTLGNMKSLQELVGICITQNAIEAIGSLTELRVVSFAHVGNFDVCKGLITMYLQRCTRLQKLHFQSIQFDYLDCIKQVPSGLQRFTTRGVVWSIPGVD